MSYGGSSYGGSPYGGASRPPQGLGIIVPVDGNREGFGTATGPGVHSSGPLTSSSEGKLDVQATLSMNISGGSVLGIFQGQSSLISRILDGLDEDMVMEAAEVLPDLTDFVDLEGSAEEKWRQFLASTVADQVRATLEPFVEQMQRHEEEMHSLFSQAFDMSERTPVDQPFTSEPTPWEIKSWSAVVAFWIMTALGTEWVLSEFHLGVIFAVLGVLIALFYNCFK